MRLIKARCGGYRRFGDRVEMDIYPHLVCVVGPNAAGKSSFLDALAHLDVEHPSGFETRERTRGVHSAPTHVEAVFLLEPDDLSAIAEISEARNCRTAILWKDEEETGFELKPSPERDLAPRHDLVVQLERYAAHPWIEKFSAQQEEDAAEDEEEGETLAAALASALRVAHSDAQTLPPEDIQLLAVLGGLLRQSDEAPRWVDRLASRVEALVHHESQRHPRDEAVDILFPGVPRFFKFNNKARNLAASYDLADDEARDEAAVNLLSLAGTTWDEALQVVQGGDRGRKAAWREAANNRLAGAITATWGQTPLSVTLDLDGTVLSVLMSMQSNDFIEIDQHSDGLRQFVALRAFLALHEGPVKPVVLIDEAETHLHYDGQADLIDVLESQRETAKIIYTTHSAGCLPRDLGTGIRAIVPVYEKDAQGNKIQTDLSTVQNKFWTHGKGFRPLLIAMGASAFAFSAAQKAAVTEGLSDAILLPTLLREAAGVDRLQYQIVPGFAEAPKDDVPQFDLMGSRVAFIADGDDGGSDHAKKLYRNGARKEQIAFLGGPRSGLALEDMLKKDLYIEAVNEWLDQRHPGRKVPSGSVPDKGRATTVALLVSRWKDAHGRPIQLDKVAVAQRLVDRAEIGLVAPRRRKTLVVLADKLTSIFAQSTHAL